MADSINKNNPPPSSSSSRADRKFIERNRRNQMKALYNHLNSLLPHHHASTSSSSEGISVADQVEEATQYIKSLQMKVEKLKESKSRMLLGIDHQRPNNNDDRAGSGCPPQIEIHQVGMALEVVLITGLDFHFIFTDLIRLLHQEGADIVNATYKLVHHNALFHTIHCQLRESNGSPATISHRLKKFVYDSTYIYNIVI